MKLRNLLIAAAGLAVVAGGAGAASANGYYYHHHYYPAAHSVWQQRHPLRVQVNRRLRTLNRSITQERREGDISAYRAHVLREHLHAVAAQERRISSRHGGHLGYAAQARLNREENNIRHHVPG